MKGSSFVTITGVTVITAMKTQMGFGSIMRTHM